MYLKESQPHPGGLPSSVCAYLLDPVQRGAMVNAARHVFLALLPFLALGTPSSPSRRKKSTYQEAVAYIIDNIT